MTRAKSKPDAMTKMQRRASEKAAERYGRSWEMETDLRWYDMEDAFLAGAAHERRRIRSEVSKMQAYNEDGGLYLWLIDSRDVLEAIKGKR